MPVWLCEWTMAKSHLAKQLEDTNPEKPRSQAGRLDAPAGHWLLCASPEEDWSESHLPYGALANPRASFWVQEQQTSVWGTSLLAGTPTCSRVGMHPDQSRQCPVI